MKSSIPADTWEAKRVLITKLYKEEEWPLKQVIKVIQTPDFHPRRSSKEPKSRSTQQRHSVEESQRPALAYGACSNTPHSSASTSCTPGNHYWEHDFPPSEQRRHPLVPSIPPTDLSSSPSSPPTHTQNYGQMDSFTSISDISTLRTPTVGLGTETMDKLSFSQTTNSFTSPSGDTTGTTYQSQDSASPRSGEPSTPIAQIHGLLDGEPETSPVFSATHGTLGYPGWLMGCGLRYPDPLAQYQAGIALCRNALPWLELEARQRIQSQDNAYLLCEQQTPVVESMHPRMWISNSHDILPNEDRHQPYLF
ncbi:hypothetical protein AOCH_001014 [Aspergillus ochraceoroseus]|uniref:Clr5 domain-containing protein n=1 Tax=Aspergillus ochraceoroseus TaxID=138278 RepID=A0A0F8ULZ0_9EURO|nr:hypothetical protein AOCH_001014 [Aspergillus ochraceoroseus]